VKIDGAGQVADPLRTALREYLIAMADDELLLGHRDSEWTGHAPILEEDIAYSNLAQDEMGHALTWYTLAHELGAPEPDRAAFFRGPDEFHNAILVELPKGDWAFTIVRQYLFDGAEQVRYAALARSTYRPICDAIAKLRNEEAYHLMHSRGWVKRLGDATEESHRRMQDALDAAWPHALGLFEPMDGEDLLTENGIKPGEDSLREQWIVQVTPILESATLLVPAGAQPTSGGRSGKHTEHLAALLSEMQLVARSEAGATW
jgi:ring-1,2-phenylacetyl-CoA epoxidase subunit PaaC